MIKFTVLHAWKGIETNEITVKSSNPCGVKLFVGESKIVYGYASENKNIIDADCCNFGSFDDERMKREYGEGKIIEEPSPVETSEGFWSELWQKIVSFFS